MEQAIFIIYVKDQNRSRNFYKSVLNMEPVLDVPGMTEFRINDYTKLGIMPEEGIEKILGNEVPNPETGNGIPRCEIYLYTGSPQKYIDRLAASGGKLISNLGLRSWGEEAAYGSDPDGHIIAFAKEKD
jgi:catechol 2,3-dioxygenase-like lactoylglutathione lyase family enzyme